MRVAIAVHTYTHPATEALAGSPFVQSLSPPTRKALSERLRPVDLAENKLLFRSHSPPDSCYLVERGTLRVTIDDHAGGETWLAILGLGDWVGELGVIDRQPRSATVTAMTQCRLWQLRIRDFDTICRQDSELFGRLVQLVCSRLRTTNRQVCNQRLGLEARLAQTLLKLARAFGEPMPDGRTMIRYRIGQSRLAEVTGASRENVNRQFKSWREAGLCERVQSHYCLSDLADWEMLGDHSVASITG